MHIERDDPGVAARHGKNRGLMGRGVLVWRQVDNRCRILKNLSGEAFWVGSVARRAVMLMVTEVLAMSKAAPHICHGNANGNVQGGCQG